MGCAEESRATLRIVLADNLEVLRALEPGSIDLIYIDPPFNTGREQRRVAVRTERDEAGDRTGFQGRRYRTTTLGATGYADRFDDYLAFLEPRLGEAHRVLTDAGSLFFHIDYREAHYCKVLLDGIFGRESFVNEIVWAYDYGGRPKNRWPAKHDTILWYAKDPAHYTFNFDEIDRIPYMAPALVGAEKAARGKTPTDVWWHTIVPTNSKEENRVFHPEAARAAGAHRQGALVAGRSAAGLLRRLRHLRRGGCQARPLLPPRRQQPRGGADHGPSPRALWASGGGN